MPLRPCQANASLATGIEKHLMYSTLEPYFEKKDIDALQLKHSKQAVSNTLALGNNSNEVKAALSQFAQVFASSEPPMAMSFCESVTRDASILGQITKPPAFTFRADVMDPFIDAAAKSADKALMQGTMVGSLYEFPEHGSAILEEAQKTADAFKFGKAWDNDIAMTISSPWGESSFQENVSRLAAIDTLLFDTDRKGKLCLATLQTELPEKYSQFAKELQDSCNVMEMQD